jgi:lyso-ornithine lipid O-acyltransferase
MTAWMSSTLPPKVSFGLAGWVRIALRGGLMAAVLLVGMFVLLLVRLVEQPLCGHARPVSPYIIQGACRCVVRIIGIRRRVRGKPMRQHGATVANHATWLDVFVLNAGERLYFVAKAEVAGWAGVGWLARLTGAMFIVRKGSAAKAQKEEMEDRLKAGHRLVFFPEGTSSDSIRVLPFKSSLFAAFLSPDLADALHVQPVTLVYRAPKGADARFYGWWSDMDFLPSLVEMLAQSPHGSVEVIYHRPLRVADFADRKALTAACEALVRAGHPNGQDGKDEKPYRP